MLDQLTVIIKTIHRPWCCARLIQSLDRYAAGLKIHVLDDGLPHRRLSATYKRDALRANQLIETEFDIGISAGRNRLLETVTTPFFLLLDDDHIVTEESKIESLVLKLESYGDNCDLLAARSNSSGTPRCFEPDPSRRILKAIPRHHKRDGDVFFCDLVPNTFVAKTKTVQAIGWDEALKVHEHWEFFYRAWMQGLRVAVSHEHRFTHRHVHTLDYKPLRSRSWYLTQGLRKHGLRQFAWTARQLAHLKE